ncbi:hypothetical protein RSOLAG22IIIB_00710 [Rhizoctonia solani]|uniref:F-box domain-containing protein n=1 Tax=Rhizoctonia solani TaxID=456999 RepID=A0A0K6FVZ9_9AGAM|nr:hypothetical protein RSOLAG22IIIB_00710 [Rhizoctonia solani]
MSSCSGSATLLVLEKIMSDYKHLHIATVFISIPIDVFKEIASLLSPRDILTLARVNKLLRRLLMQRSAKHIWRAAESSVDKLPPCPRHLTNPQYAALVFSKECSSCGITVMRRLDHVLGVRLCNACRSTKVVGLSYAPSPIREYVPTSSKVKNPRTNEIRFALRSEIHELVGEFWNLPDDCDHPDFLRWINKKLKRRLERIRHATALARYINFTSAARDKELENTKLHRVIEVYCRLSARGWKPKDMEMASEDSEKAWYNLVHVRKPLTDRAWERLYPKLLRLLKLSKRRLQAKRAKNRLSKRYQLVEEMLADMRATNSVRLEMADTGQELVNNAGTTYLPFPVLSEVMQYHVFKDLVETDRSLDATKVKFRASANLVTNAISKWRARLESHLIGLANDNRKARKRDYPIGNELIEEPAPFSSRLVAGSYSHITPRNNFLFRADSVFSHKHVPLFYPRNFTPWFDTAFTIARPPEADRSVLDVICSSVTFHPEGAGYAAAVLKELGRPDASHVEMEALGERFICNRCLSRTVHSWTSLISHFLHAYSCATSTNSQPNHKTRIVFNNVHNWATWPERPLVRLLNDQELAIHDAATLLDTTGKMVECGICYDPAVPCPAARRFVMLHLRHYHNISQPVFGEHYFEVPDECAGSDAQLLGISLALDSAG